MYKPGNISKRKPVIHEKMKRQKYILWGNQKVKQKTKIGERLSTKKSEKLCIRIKKNIETYSL